MRDLLRHSVPSVTDARPSADDDRRSRRRRYTVLMALHLVGLAVGGLLYQQAWTLGLIILIITGPLQWVAVILANDGRRRTSASDRRRGLRGTRPPRRPVAHRSGGVPEAVDEASHVRAVSTGVPPTNAG